MTPADSQPLGPEDQGAPDRDAQVDEVPAEHELQPKDGGPGRSDLEDGAWKTEATWEGHDEAPKGDEGSEDDGVDPVVHRGE